MSELLSPGSHAVLRKYQQEVVRWHGYARFLGMPNLKDNPDIRLNHIYVGQSVSKQHLSPDEKPEKGQRQNPLRPLIDERRLVVLGDPGTGKSTLINYIAWYLSSGFSKKLADELAQTIPIPMTLRELKLNDVKTFDDLFQAFLDHPVAKQLKENPGVLDEYIAAGEVIFLIDGLDEISAIQRKNLRLAIIEGFEKHQNCFFLCTSRIVGYDDAPLKKQETNRTPEGLPIESDPLAPAIRYCAPFTDQQIEQFAQNWYLEQSAPGGAGLLSVEFIKAIKANETTQRLARTPNLLAMMALIFKIRSQLPNGRALLYDDIAQAYLESIDTARKLNDPIPWQKKKNWLARIGFEMQIQRQKQLDQGDSQELLIPRSDILNWIEAAMEVSGDQHDEGYAEQYLQWVTRRSGLLIPRGNGLYTFMHLSFQEYFAAFYIQQQLQNPEWLDRDEDEDDSTLDPRVDKNTFAQWANSPNWQQALIFLFELFDGKAGWSKRLWKYCFKNESFDTQVEAWRKEELSEHHLWLEFPLQIELLSNPNSGTPEKIFNIAKDKLIELAFAEQNLKGYVISITPLLVHLLSSSKFESHCLATLDQHRYLTSLSLRDLKDNFTDKVFDWLASSTKLVQLDLTNTSMIGLEVLRDLKALQLLIINDTKVNDTLPLLNLPNLIAISAVNIPAVDFSPLKKLPNLSHLFISDNKEMNIEGLDPEIIRRY